MRQEEPDKEIHHIFDLRAIGIVHGDAHRHAGRNECAEENERALPEAVGVHHAETGEEPLKRCREQARFRVYGTLTRDWTRLGAHRYWPVAHGGARPRRWRDAARGERRSRRDDTRIARGRDTCLRVLGDSGRGDRDGRAAMAAKICSCLQLRPTRPAPPHKPLALPPPCADLPGTSCVPDGILLAGWREGKRGKRTTRTSAISASPSFESRGRFYALFASMRSRATLAQRAVSSSTVT
jgi:hypothetical protein